MPLLPHYFWNVVRDFLRKSRYSMKCVTNIRARISKSYSWTFVIPFVSVTSLFQCISITCNTLLSLYNRPAVTYILHYITVSTQSAMELVSDGIRNEVYFNIKRSHVNPSRYLLQYLAFFFQDAYRFSFSRSPITVSTWRLLECLSILARSVQCTMYNTKCECQRLRKFSLKHVQEKVYACQQRQGVAKFCRHEMTQFFIKWRCDLLAICWKLFVISEYADFRTKLMFRKFLFQA